MTCSYRVYVVIFGKGKKKTLKYTKLIKEMYNKIIVYVDVRTSGGITSEFPITIGLH